MHMADALVSPAVGGTMWVVSAGLIGYCSAQAKKQLDDRTAPLMGVLGAFIFAAQMINFTIPATGSSGHLGGGLLLAILLGPSAAFLTISSILIVQALFFADGGILALGCNIFNIGFFPCLIAYPFFYKPITTGTPSRARIFTGAIIASIAALQLGSLGVVLETTLSRITELPLITFALFMQPIHLGIGLAEGLVTASIILFLHTARPELLNTPHHKLPAKKASILPVLKTFALAALIIGGGISWFASTHPDGLEWSIFKTSGTIDLENKQNNLHESMAAFQKRSVILPDYGFASQEENEQDSPTSFSKLKSDQLGTTTSGLLGTGIFLLFTVIISFLFKLRRAQA
jgi:cobalt/nickel transport system permease protein